MTTLRSVQASESALDPMLRKLEYRSKFTAADREALLALPHNVKTLEADHYVVRERGRATHTSVMLSGFAVRHKMVVGGRRQILALHLKGEIVDLQNSFLATADHSVQMLTAGVVATIPREAIDRIAFERPAIGRAILIDTLVDASIYREWIANVGRRDAQTRIAHFLCELSLRLKNAGLGEEGSYQLPMRQEELGDAAGLTTVHVNRSLQSLEAQGLIRRPTPRAIQIADWKKLAEAGDFDSSYLHLKEYDSARAERPPDARDLPKAGRYSVLKNRLS